jgi:hypothetical protein
VPSKGCRQSSATTTTLGDEQSNGDDSRLFHLRLAFAGYLPDEARLGMLEPGGRVRRGPPAEPTMCSSHKAPPGAGREPLGRLNRSRT